MTLMRCSVNRRTTQRLIFDQAFHVFGATHLLKG